MDRAFEGLLFSLAIHAIFVWIYLHMPTPPPMSFKTPTEVTFIDPPTHKSKVQQFVEETSTKPVETKELSDAADFLAQFTKRVKKQIRAREVDKTRNSTPNAIATERKGQDPGQRDGVAGMTETTPRERTQGDFGLPAPGGNKSLRQVSIGPSTISEYLPGIEQGDFTALNTDQSTYYAFYSRINEQIRNRWIAGLRGYISRLSDHDQELLSKMDRETILDVTLTPDGEIQSMIVTRSCGDRGLDQTNAEAIRSTAPFINPPKGMIDSDGLIHMPYGFHLSFRPPLGQAGY